MRESSLLDEARVFCMDRMRHYTTKTGGILVPVLAAFFLLRPSLLSAQTPSQTEVELPSVVVEASLPDDLGALAAGTSMLDSSDLASMPARSLSEAMSSLPGMLVSPNGPSGSQTTVSLRGSTSNQVLILVDGMRISDVSTGVADLSRILIPLDMIDRIEIQRGSLSAAYGADAVGGIIHIHTRQPSGSLSWKIAFRNISFLPVGVIAGSGLPAIRIPFVARTLADGQQIDMYLEHGNVVLWSTFSHEANLYPYYDSNGLRRSRTNADMSSTAGGIRWAVPFTAGRFSVAASASWRSLGVPGALDAPTPDARQRDWHADISAQFRTDALAQGAIALELLSYARIGDLWYRESSTLQPDEHASRRVGADIHISWLPPAESWLGEIKGGASLRYDRLESDTVKKPDNSIPERISIGIFAEPTIHIGSWTAATAIRLDSASDFSPGLSAALGLLRPFGQNHLGINISTAYRAPSFDDLYWPASGGVEGNPDLQPESAVSADITLRHEGTAGEWILGTFARYSQKVILWQPDVNGIWKPTNFGNALYPGLEAEVRWSGAGWLLRASYTFLYSFVLSGNLTIWDDRRVPYVPLHAAAVTASRKDRNFSSGFTLRYQGIRYTGIGNIAFLPAVFTADAQFSWELSKRSLMELTFSNLFNERYEFVKGYPMPGFALSARLLVKSAPQHLVRGGM